MFNEEISLEFGLLINNVLLIFIDNVVMLFEVKDVCEVFFRIGS